MFSYGPSSHGLKMNVTLNSNFGIYDRRSQSTDFSAPVLQRMNFIGQVHLATTNIK
jgi:hypothetical protein